MNHTATQLVKDELATVIHHIDYYTNEVTFLESALADAQDKLHGWKARAVALEDALSEGVAA